MLLSSLLAPTSLVDVAAAGPAVVDGAVAPSVAAGGALLLGADVVPAARAASCALAFFSATRAGQVGSRGECHK